MLARELVHLLYALMRQILGIAVPFPVNGSEATQHVSY